MPKREPDTGRTSGEIRLLVAHSNALYRAGCHHALSVNPAMRVVAEADRSDHAYSAFCESVPTVCVLEYSLPGAGGPAIIRRMRARAPTVGIVLVDMRDDGTTAAHALEHGVSACLGMNGTPHDLLQAVEEVARGGRYLTREIAQQIALLRLRPNNKVLSQLSPREFEIFRLVSSGMRAPDIAGALCLSVRSVANYTSQVKRKLGVATTAELVHLALRHNVIDIAAGS